MKEELERMIVAYKRLIPTEETPPDERVFLAKQRKDLWWEIRQASKGFPNAMRMKVYRAAHPEKALEQWIHQRDRLRERKVEVLTHYGKGRLACVKCGFTDIRTLSIDHIEGRGNRHRQGKLRTSASFYAWLKKKDWPMGYQTLCMNCQFIKRDENNEQGKYATEPIDFQR